MAVHHRPQDKSSLHFPSSSLPAELHTRAITCVRPHLSTCLTHYNGLVRRRKSHSRNPLASRRNLRNPGTPATFVIFFFFQRLCCANLSETHKERLGCLPAFPYQSKSHRQQRRVWRRSERHRRTRSAKFTQHHHHHTPSDATAISYATCAYSYEARLRLPNSLFRSQTGLNALNI